MMLSRESTRDELVAVLEADYPALAALLPADTQASCLFQAAQHNKGFAKYFDAVDEGPVLRALSRLECYFSDLLEAEAKDEKARAKAKRHREAVERHRNKAKRPKQAEEPPPPPTMS